MKAIMISDHSKWCALMMNGKKTIEARTSKTLYKAIQKLIDKNGYADIYVYCSKDEYLYRTNKEYIASKKPLTVGKGTEYTFAYSDEGKVIFKFRCYKVEEIVSAETIGVPIYCTHSLFQRDLCKKSCLTPYDFNDYLKGKKGYAIHISDLEIFDEPKELSEFRQPRDSYGKVNWNTTDYYYMELTKAPQSFCYVEVEVNE